MVRRRLFQIRRLSEEMSCDIYEIVSFGVFVRKKH